MKLGENITLGGLAFACYVYDKAYGDKAYIDFLSSTNNSPDLSKDAHCEALFKFLNKWNCRLPKAEEYRKNTCQEIKSWYKEYKDKLPQPNRNLWDLTKQELNNANFAYEKLKSQNDGFRNDKPRTIAETAAAKILFAVRPKSLIAWDREIRKEYVGENGSYFDFLEKMKFMTDELKIECQKHGFELNNLTEKLKRPYYITVPKLIDEYNWITKTKKCSPPDKQTLQQWVRWSI